ncbi:MAG: hypothetical protein QME40_02095 [bacterium]|nr:hypothetical protein [bacterium]
MQRFRLRLIFLSSIFLMLSYNVSAADQALDLAERFFSQENYEEVITECKRFIFFHPEDKEGISYAFYKIGLAYAFSSNWDKAKNALRESIELTEDSRIKDERSVDLGIVLIANKNYSLGELELLKVSCFSEDESIRKKAIYFQGIGFLYMFKWKEAKETFMSCYPGDEAEELKDQLEKAQHLAYKSPKKAKILSLFLPGSGQIYAGNLKDGICALLLNGLIGAFMVRAIGEKDWWDATSLFFLFQRYYRGNLYHAQEQAELYNQELDRKQAWKILRTLKEME